MTYFHFWRYGPSSEGALMPFRAYDGVGNELLFEEESAAAAYANRQNETRLAQYTMPEPPESLPERASGRGIGWKDIGS